MGYERLNLKTGQVITEDVFAHLEDGIEGAANAALMTPILYADLVALRNAGQLKAGMFYCITDYVTTTIQENTQSAGHAFDVIVMATDERTLSEEARAIVHEGDTYFTEAGANLAAWQIWYSLDNDTQRFAWADAENGKGVIYRLIDEWNNDCPYDFKNIQFMRRLYTEGGGIEREQGDGDYDVYCYTFSWEDEDAVIMDVSLVGNNGYIFNDENQIEGVYGNVIKAYISYTGDIENPRKAQQFLNNIVFLSTYAFEERYFYGCHSNSFGNGCHSNSFGNGCKSNSFGNFCQSNSFGNGCISNSFGNFCHSNSFGNGCHSNSFGNGCHSNSFGNDCQSNSFGNDCINCVCGNDWTCCTFGDGCQSCSVGTTSAEPYVRGVIFESLCAGKIYTSTTASAYQQVQNVRLLSGFDSSKLVERNLEPRGWIVGMDEEDEPIIKSLL